jgi:spermidine synthase
MAQTLLLRQGILLGGGNELLLGLHFFLWFMGIAAGAWLSFRWTPRGNAFPYLAGLFPWIALLSGAAAFGVHALFPPPAGTLPGLAASAVHAALLMFPPGLWIGAAFRAAAEASRGIARTFLWESLGSALGGILLTLVLLPLAGPFHLLLGLACTGALVLPGRSKALLLLPALAWITAARPLESLRWKGMELPGTIVSEQETPYQSLLLVRNKEATAVYLNGRYATQFPDVTRSAQRYRPFLAQGAALRRVVLAGEFPFESEAGLLTPAMESLTILQPDPSLYKAVEPMRRNGPDPRVRYALTDARAFFRHEGDRCDLVLLDAGMPASILANRLFTEEFFFAVKRRLEPGGAFILFLPVSQDYWGEEVLQWTASVYRTLTGAFPHILMAFGDTPAFVAASDASGISDSPDALAARAAGRGMEAFRFTPGLFQVIYSKDRWEQFLTALKTSKGDINSDRRPFGYLPPLAIQEKMNAQVPLLGLLLRTPAWTGFLLWGFALLFLSRSRRPLFQVFSTGFLGIGVFILLSLGYQTVHGTLYSALGLLTGLFMLGLAASAPAAEWLHRKHAPAWMPDALALLLLGAVVLVHQQSAGFYYSAIFISGTVLGLPFTFVGLRQGNDGAAAAQMELTDHLGAAGGALLTGLFLLPILGIAGTLIVFAGLRLISAVFTIKY